MLKKESLNKLYEMVIKNQALNRQCLLSCGFKEQNIIELVLEGYLKIKGLHNFEFRKVRELYQYSMSLLGERRSQDAKNGFKKCLELNPTYYDAALQLFIKEIELEEYNHALIYLQVMAKSDKLEEDEKAFYLYLLNFLTPLKESEKEYLHGLTKKDFLIKEDDPRYLKYSSINYIRKLALKQKFSLAKRKLNELFPMQYVWIPEHFALRLLFKQNIKLQKENNAYLSKLSYQGKFKEIIEFINNLQKERPLNSYLEIILYLATEIETIINTGQMPKVKKKDTNSFQTAIYRNNFKLALDIKKRSEKERLNHDAVYYLLEKIISLTDKKEMSNDKCEELKIPELVIAAENRGIIILPEMDKDERMFKFTKLCDYPNVSVFLIGEKDRERIVIKSGRHGDKEVDIDSLVKISKESLDLKHYDECIKANLELLKHCRFSLETYIRLGICYYYLGEYDLAIDYLTIPTETCKKENLPACYDFSNLIKSIEKLQEDEKGLTR